MRVDVPSEIQAPCVLVSIVCLCRQMDIHQKDKNFFAELGLVYHSEDSACECLSTVNMKSTICGFSDGSVSGLFRLAMRLRLRFFVIKAFASRSGL